MRIAEALIERAALHRRIEDLRARITRYARIQEDETPAEDPQVLISELDRALRHHTTLVQAINRTNAATAYDEDRTITDAIAERDEAATRQRIFKELAAAAAGDFGGGFGAVRATRTEIRLVSTIDGGGLQRSADEWAKRYRELDTRLQELNWRTELLE